MKTVLSILLSVFNLSPFSFSTCVRVRARVHGDYIRSTREKGEARRERGECHSIVNARL